VRHLLIVASFVAVFASATVVEGGFWFRFFPFAAFFYMYGSGKRGSVGSTQLFADLVFSSFGMVGWAIAGFYLDALIPTEHSVSETIRQFIQPICTAAIFAFLGGVLGAYCLKSNPLAIKTSQ
jgi:hypothetical protein